MPHVLRKLSTVLLAAKVINPLINPFYYVRSKSLPSLASQRQHKYLPAAPAMIVAPTQTS
jgi:hypothetical protein